MEIDIDDKSHIIIELPDKAYHEALAKVAEQANEIIELKKRLKDAGL